MSFFIFFLLRLFSKYDQWGGDVFDFSSTVAVTLWALLFYYFVYGREETDNEKHLIDDKQTEETSFNVVGDENLNIDNTVDLWVVFISDYLLPMSDLVFVFAVAYTMVGC